MIRPTGQDGGDDRGQAVTLNYTIGIAIATVLVTGLLIAGSSFVGDQQEKAVRSELRVIGQQTAASLETTDRLANTTDTGNPVQLERELPPNVAGTSYQVDLVTTADPATDPYLVLTTDNPEVEVRVDFSNRTKVAPSTVDGGTIVFEYQSDGKVHIEEGDD